MAIDEETWASRLVDAACRVVGAKHDVKSITVVENERLPYDELARLRETAATQDADFVMEGDGTVVVQRKLLVPALDPLFPTSNVQADDNAADSTPEATPIQQEHSVPNRP